MKGYKALKKDMTCQGFKFEENKTYKEKKAVICQTGFHFCENPFDLLSYYDLCDSEFVEVEALGDIDKQQGDSKRCTTKIKIGVKIGLGGFVKAAVSFLINFCKKDNSSGYSSQQASSGDYSQQASSGDYSKQASSGNSSKQASSGNSSKQASSGNYSKHIIDGKHSVAAAIGINSTIRGKKGNWITLAEWKNDNGVWVPVCVKSVKIDGKKIKEDVYYKLIDKKFVEV